MVEFSSSSEILDVVSNATTTLAYYWLTFQLLSFAVNSKLVKFTCFLWQSKDKKKRHLFCMLLSVAALFACFIFLCGTTHLLSVIRFYYPSTPSVKNAQLIMLVLCAAVSVITAIIASRMLPIILDSIGNFELTSEGNLQHAENYLIEIVELIKESIIVLSEDLEIVRCNEASKLLLGTSQCLQRNYKEFIHPHDLHIFNNAVSRVMGSYSATPVTIEYRVNQATTFSGRYRPLNKVPLNRRSSSAATNKVYVGDEETVVGDVSPMSRQTTSVPGLELSHKMGIANDASTSTIPISGKSEDYTWIESTICKGMSLKHGDDFEYDIKLVSRNIEERKKAALTQYNEILKENEERARTNAAKLRYISCIAHDLKTPLQSFCFSLDLLSQTQMFPEQREYVQQANVAVDLMKLTISQTMDISKALTGAKLMPRRTTVYLSSIVHRVEIIINGYGKQVPVTFEIAPDVYDRIITDEEWLWQMMLNLLTNACKYTDRGEIRVVLSRKNNTANFSHSFEEEMLMIEVIDTGVGVDDAKIGSIFDAFAQVQSGQVVGTGLGLFGVRTRAEGLLGACGARHNTESSTGTGTVLWFAVPYVPDNSDDSHNGTARGVVFQRSATSLIKQSLSAALSLRGDGLHSPPTGDRPRTGDRTVDASEGETEDDPMLTFIRAQNIRAMVIDDTKTVRKLMEKLLMKMGFASVVCYENGAKGLDAMMAAPVDIVFSDVQMPIMTGPEMVRRFRKFEAEALESGARQVRQLVVAVTANGSELTDSVNNGFDEVCPKPLSVRDIENLVQKYFV